MEKQLVVFNLANEQFGIDIDAVSSIVEWHEIKAVPYAPPFVEGVTNLRGMVLPVIDLRKRFRLPQKKITANTRIIIVELNGETIGLIVDAVSEVLRVPEKDIDPPSPILITARSTFIAGIAKVGERLIIVIAQDRLFSLKEKHDLANLRQAQDASAP
ncbi:MAG: chemotaxis protein CheW [Anaerolineae bacterium]|nr:chemotaxis protein CheW [Anaerolineae bacterium]